MVLDNCCWGAKTVFGQTDIEHQNKVRLICGRNAVTYSFGVDNYSEVDPNKLGEMVLQIGMKEYQQLDKCSSLLELLF